MTKLTDNERASIQARIYAVRDDAVATGLVTSELWEEYRDSPKEFEAHSLINSCARLYQLCKPGTEIATVFVRSTQDYNGNSKRVWKLFVAHGGEVVLLTGYVVDVCGYRRAKDDDTALITTGYGSDVVGHLSYKLYGDERLLKQRTF